MLIRSESEVISFMLRFRPFSVGLFILFLAGVPGHSQTPQPQVISISINVDKAEVGEGQNVVVTAVAKHANGDPATGVSLHAHSEWQGMGSGISYAAVRRGASATSAAGDRRQLHHRNRWNRNTSSPVVVQVDPRHFDIILDPDHLVGMEYETWFAPGYAQWGQRRGGAHPGALQFAG